MVIGLVTFSILIIRGIVLIKQRLLNEIPVLSQQYTEWSEWKECQYFVGVPKRFSSTRMLLKEGGGWPN